MQTTRDRISLAIGLVLVALSMMGGWQVGFPLLAVAICFLVWGRYPREVEARLKNFPLGVRAVQWLHGIDRFVFPRDEAQEARIKKNIGGYDPVFREALRKYYTTGNHNLLTGDQQDTFYRDGLYQAGTGNIKPELKDTILKSLEAFANENAPKDVNHAR